MSGSDADDAAMVLLPRSLLPAKLRVGVENADRLVKLRVPSAEVRLTGSKIGSNQQRVDLLIQNGTDWIMLSPVDPLAAHIDLLATARGKRFGTVLTDPPWPFQNRTGKV